VYRRWDDDDGITLKTASNNYNLAIISIVAALALLGVVVVIAALTIPLQEAEAGCERGPAVNQLFWRTTEDASTLLLSVSLSAIIPLSFFFFGSWP
jgi:hypothetical protein